MFPFFHDVSGQRDTGLKRAPVLQYHGPWAFRWCSVKRGKEEKRGTTQRYSEPPHFQKTILLSLSFRPLYVGIALWIRRLR